MAIFGSRLTLRNYAVGASRLESARPAGSPANGEINLNNILLLIPGEIVSIYLTCKDVVGKAEANVPPGFFREHWKPICFLSCLAACFVLRAQASKPADSPGFFDRVNWRMALVTSFAFFLWGHAVNEVGPLFPAFSGPYAAFFAAIFGIFAPRLAPIE